MSVRLVTKAFLVCSIFAAAAGVAQAEDSHCIGRISDAAAKMADSGIPVSSKEIDFGEFYRLSAKDSDLSLATARKISDLGTKTNVVYSKQHIGLAMIGATSVMAMDAATCEVLIKAVPGMGSKTMQVLTDGLQKLF